MLIRTENHLKAKTDFCGKNQSCIFEKFKFSFLW